MISISGQTGGANQLGTSIKQSLYQALNNLKLRQQFQNRTMIGPCGVWLTLDGKCSYDVSVFVADVDCPSAPGGLGPAGLLVFFCDFGSECCCCTTTSCRTAKTAAGRAPKIVHYTVSLSRHTSCLIFGPQADATKWCTRMVKGLKASAHSPSLVAKTLNVTFAGRCHEAADEGRQGAAGARADR